MKLLTQTKARKILREQGGFSIEKSRQAVEDLKKVADGKREKVRGADLARILSEISKPSPAISNRISRPLSRRMREQIRGAN